MSKLTKILEEYKKLGISEQIDHDKFYLYSIITHSTAVEGSTVTEIENRLLFDEGISPQRPIIDQLMNLDLKKAYEEAKVLTERHAEYSIEILCHLSALTMKNTGKEYKTLTGNFNSSNGDLRLVNVTAGRGGKSYMSYQKVPKRLEDFCNWINSQRKSINPNDIDKIYELSFMAHYNLVYIHPWADGNGRMARLVMNMIQMEFGVIPSVVNKDKRDKYIKSLALSQETDDLKPFMDFMMDHHYENLKKAITEYLQSIENDTINIVNDTLNDTLNDTINIMPNENLVLNLIKDNSDITISDIVIKTGLSRPTINRIVLSLKNKGVLERCGAKKNGKWKILM